MRRPVPAVPRFDPDGGGRSRRARRSLPGHRRPVEAGVRAGAGAGRVRGLPRRRPDHAVPGHVGLFVDAHAARRRAGRLRAAVLRSAGQQHGEPRPDRRRRAPAARGDRRHAARVSALRLPGRRRDLDARQLPGSGRQPAPDAGPDVRHHRRARPHEVPRPGVPAERRRRRPPGRPRPGGHDAGRDRPAHPRLQGRSPPPVPVHAVRRPRQRAPAFAAGRPGADPDRRRRDAGRCAGARAGGRARAAAATTRWRRSPSSTCA